jgi:hypothetical protein
MTALPLKRFAPWSAAKPTFVNGRRFGSKLEARVFAELTLEAKATGAMLFCHVRFPLLNLAPDEKGQPLGFTPDFVLIYPDNTVRVVDPKGRPSPEWERGKRAFKALYGLEVETITT